MGNKSNGRALAAMPFSLYTRMMGGDVENIKNTGISFTNLEVMKYFKELRLYALNRCRWTSDQIDERELRLIEWNIFHHGRCAMLRPKIIKDGVCFRLTKPKIYQCNYIDTNARNGEPIKIGIINEQSRLAIIDINYYADEFVIFTDEFCFFDESIPASRLAWEFACKLHELDLAFNANSHRLRMPFVFNNGAAETEKDGTFNLVANRGITIAETMRSAFGRNEQFVELPDSMVGDNFLHEPQHVENHMLEHIESQKKLYDAYFERLGLRTNKEKGGSYTVKELQEDGDESPNYITQVQKSTRLLCAEKAVDMFKITLALEVRE